MNSPIHKDFQTSGEIIIDRLIKQKENRLESRGFWKAIIYIVGLWLLVMTTSYLAGAQDIVDENVTINGVAVQCAHPSEDVYVCQPK